MPFAQSGRRGTVYQLNDEEEQLWALKVFQPRFREPRLVGQAERIRTYASLPGLRTCEREVFTSSKHLELIQDHRDLAYAVLMPWIHGQTWFEVVAEGGTLTSERSMGIARSLAGVLLSMEESGLAHCDLSGPNVIVTPEGQVELVDLEEMYGPNLIRPKSLPGGSPGYAHKTAPEGLWRDEADRFAGAVLLAETLGWCDERVVAVSWGEGYFVPDEMQQECERFVLLRGALAERWGAEVGEYFERAWFSGSLLECPTFTEWLAALPDRTPVQGLSRAAKGEISHQVEEHAVAVADSAGLESARVVIATEADPRVRRFWRCTSCGKSVSLHLSICPHCEQGHRPPLDSEIGKESLAAWDAAAGEPPTRLFQSPIARMATAMTAGLFVIGGALLARSIGTRNPTASTEELVSATTTRVNAIFAYQTSTAAMGATPTSTASSQPTLEPTAEPTPVAGPSAIAPGNLNAVQLLRVFETGKTVDSLDLSPDGSLLAMGLCRRNWRQLCPGETLVIRTRDGVVLRSIHEHSPGVTRVAFSPNGSHLASASLDGTIVLWDVITARTVALPVGHRAGINDLSWSPDGALLSSAGNDGTVRLWSVESAAQMRILEHEAPAGITWPEAIGAVAWSPLGDELAARAIHAYTIHIWDPETGVREKILHPGKMHYLQPISWSLDGTSVAVGHESSTTIYDTESWSPRRSIEDVELAAWSPTGDVIATINHSEAILGFWDPGSWTELRRIEFDEHPVSITWSASGDLVAIGFDDRVEFWGIN